MSISSGSMNFLSDLDIEEQKKMADHGDIKSAILLYKYFTFSNFDEEQAFIWLKKAAELGDAVCQYNLAVFFENLGDFASAKRWGKLAYDGGNEKAGRFLK